MADHSLDPQPSATESSLPTEKQAETPPSSPTPPTVMKTKSPVVYIVGFLIALIVISVAATSAFAYAVTYQQLSVGNPDLEKSIQQTVQRLPFTPKTPEFLLESMAEAQKTVSKHSFDLSIATQSDTLAAPLGLNSLELSAKGKVDYSNLENIQTDLQASLSNQYNLQMRKKDQMIYVKLDKLPEYVYLLLSLPKEKVDPLLTQWISFDVTPLNTDAKKYLDDQSEQSNASEKMVDRMRDILKEPAILAKFKQSSEKVGDHDAYKLEFVADPVTIDYLGKEIEKEMAKDYPSQSLYYTQQEEKKLSDTVKALTINVWIDKQSYYMRKMISSVTVAVPDYSSMGLGAANPLDPTTTPTKEMQFAIALTLDQFGEVVQVDAPSPSITSEEMLKQLQAIPVSP